MFKLKCMIDFKWKNVAQTRLKSRVGRVTSAGPCTGRVICVIERLEQNVGIGVTKQYSGYYTTWRIDKEMFKQ